MISLLRSYDRCSCCWKKKGCYQMKVLRYKDLETKGFEKKIANIEKSLSEGKFREAEVKKLLPSGYYRAKLDKDSRLLFDIAKYNDKKIILLLELIRSHRYERSRFLNGVVPDMEQVVETAAVPSDGISTELKFLEEKQNQFHFLNKPIIFDFEQEHLLQFPFPCIIVGSAGSGKTAISLEKMKMLTGDILYVTLSSYLAENSRDVYYSSGYHNDKQNLSFLSYQEFLESFTIPEGREVTFKDFERWFLSQKVKGVKAHELFEEFKGVLTGVEINKPFLSRAEYLSLGVKQSIFLEEQRELVYDIFEKYQQFLSKSGLYDYNLLSHSYLDKIEKRYDYVLIDEIQDFTNIQVYLLLQSLKKHQQDNFLFCGDSNQIVHPNFFSWSHLKSLFFKEELARKPIFNILQKNYRSSQSVTELANRVLLIKNRRFGSIDKESNYLITPIGDLQGQLDLVGMKEKTLKKLNEQSAKSTQFAIIVLHDSDKLEAKKHFKTPLVFSIREVKGLEYENIILFNFISGERDIFREIVSGVNSEHLQHTELAYRRAKNKEDKSLEKYKFFINSLYVAISRSTRNLYWVEKDLRHPLLPLLELEEQKNDLELKVSQSSQEDWQREAQRLAKQGKDEQAEAILSDVLKIKPTPWGVYTHDDIAATTKEAYTNGFKQSQRKLLAYAVCYHDPFAISALKRIGNTLAGNIEGSKSFVVKRFCKDWQSEKEIMSSIKNYGINYKNPLGLTPLMGAVLLGNVDLVEKILQEGANPSVMDISGRTAFDIATCEALTNNAYMTQKYPKLYKLLAPGSLKIKVDNKLIKVDSHLMEFHLINFFKVGMWYWLLPSSAVKPNAFVVPPSFRAVELAGVLEQFPESVLLERRKKRPYVSSILSKNEMKRQDKYNRKLFLRQKTGHYFLNPELEIWSDGKWVKFYSMLGLERFEHTSANGIVQRKINFLKNLQEDKSWAQLPAYAPGEYWNKGQK